MGDSLLARPLHDYRRGRDAIREAAEGVGRDPAEITPAVMVTAHIGPRPQAQAELERYVAEFYGYPLELVGSLQASFAGTVEGLVDHLRTYWDAGARVVVLRMASLDDTARQLDAVATDVVPAAELGATAVAPGGRG